MFGADLGRVKCDAQECQICRDVSADATTSNRATSDFGISHDHVVHLFCRFLWTVKQACGTWCRKRRVSVLHVWHV